MKRPLKVVMIPINKFKEEVIPHHQRIYDQQKAIVLKLLGQNKSVEVCHEIKQHTQYCRQITDLIYELDSLRTQVEDVDLEQFDAKAVPLKTTLLKLIKGYLDLEKRYKIVYIIEDDTPELNDPKNPFETLQQIELHENLNDVRLKQQQELLEDVENINQETGDLHEIFIQLNQMVESQGEDVQHIEEATESTHKNVESGVKHLATAHRIRAAAYPFTGAFIGGIIGGPIGLVAGLKVGGLAALSCAIAGYTGGKFFKEKHDNTQLTNNEIPSDLEKKDL